jgi:hypothetical protein
VARMKAEGRKLPSGRKAGAAWITDRMWSGRGPKRRGLAAGLA